MSKALNFLVLFISVTFLLLEINGFNGISTLSDRIEIRIFIDENAEPDLIEKALKNEPCIKRLIFISREEALNEFRKSIKESATFLDGITENPLPQSFRVILKQKYNTPHYLEELEKLVMQIQGVNSFIYSKEYLRNIWIISGYYEWIVTGINIVLLLLLIFTMTTSLKQTVLSTREELILLNNFGVSAAKLRTKIVARFSIENIIFASISIGVSYAIYKWLMLTKIPIADTLVFFSTNTIFIFTGGIAAISLVISLVVCLFMLNNYDRDAV